jgi:hypothetical protein
MKYWVAPLLAALLVVPIAYADKDKGEGQGQDKNDGNRGQITSECNHRANERDLKGQDRKDYVEWCESRGAKHGYDYRRYEGSRECYIKANEKRLVGGRREEFIRKCLKD